MPGKKPAISRKLLKLRKRAKQKKPEFLRSESWRYSKMSESWRRPRGLDHKMRRKIKGWPPMVNTGYKGPKLARGLHPSGLREVMVHNVKELEAVDATVQAARIAHTVGKKKRVLILAEAQKKKIHVLNPGIKEAAEEEGEEAGELAEEEEPVVEAEETPETETEKSKSKPATKKKPREEVPVEEPKKKTQKRAKSEEGAKEQ